MHLDKLIEDIVSGKLTLNEASNHYLAGMIDRKLSDMGMARNIDQHVARLPLKINLNTMKAAWEKDPDRMRRAMKKIEHVQGLLWSKNPPRHIYDPNYDRKVGRLRTMGMANNMAGNAIVAAKILSQMPKLSKPENRDRLDAATDRLSRAGNDLWHRRNKRDK